ncbi:hypothetical protein BN1723_019716 [Verticillium longisporum]|uniref:Uncharacterized protein n=1 Tax=Verticillium longisporum TaxID=100787 RepID=A0A0G4NG56_VERLO|nr:hypothetical protein BN1723_019716 [Verticillium longisporum]
MLQRDRKRQRPRKGLCQIHRPGCCLFDTGQGGEHKAGHDVGKPQRRSKLPHGANH